MKQQQLTFEKGITNIPSDAVCSDNALEESLGMVFRDGEHHVIQPPKQDNTLTGLNNSYGQLFFVHNVPEGKVYVFRKNDAVSVYLYPSSWGTALSILTASGDCQFSAVGNVLIIVDDNGIHYFLWKAGTYEKVGNSYDIGLPEPSVDFWMQWTDGGEDDVKNSNSYRDIIIFDDDTHFGIDADKQETFNNLVVGLYAKNKKEQAKNNVFTRPFLVRYALSLYDGSYAMISNPILMFPSVTRNTYARRTAGKRELHMYTSGSRLFFKNNTDLTKYSDLVKGIAIFVSHEIEIYDTDGDQEFVNVPTGTSNIVSNGIYHIKHVTGGSESASSAFSLYRTRGAVSSYYCLKQRSEEDIVKDIKGTSVFYKLCEIGLALTSSTGEDVAHYTKPHVLETITTQEQLGSDDYYSHCKLFPKVMYAYNSRLNVANVKRRLFDGFEFFMPYDDNASLSESSYTIYVKIATESGDITVSKTFSTRQYQGIYFYYPDTRAKEAWIKKGSSQNNDLVKITLSEHEGLNGAVYLKGLPNDNNYEPTGTQAAPSVSQNKTEQLNNLIVTSEVNNPFLFKAEGYNKVGIGNIIGMSTQTQALSQGQFGQYPLLVFSESGIWAMSVNNTGLYSSIHPMSREVCNNVRSITQTDGAVFFSSKKGLMRIVGSDVRCVSEQLSGKTNSFKPTSTDTEQTTSLGNFLTYLSTCFIAYDYRDSLLWILDGATYTSGGTSTVGSPDCWIYSMKSGTFAKAHLGTSFRGVTSDYPDNLVCHPSTTYSFSGRGDVNADAATYSATLISRPMKLEDALALKTIMEARHIRQMALTYDTTETVEGEATTVTHPTLQFYIYASNNMTSWVQLKSLRGIPWKYYRFKYVFANLKAVDTFAGTVIVTDERRTNKLR